MQLESKIASTLGEGATVSTTARNRREIVQQILSKGKNPIKKGRGAETRRDIISASVVIGLTAQFVTFIFASVTEFVTRLIDSIAISLFIGVIVSLIAYALMKED